MVLKILPPIWFTIFLVGGLLLHYLVPASHGFYLSLPYERTVGLIVFGVGFFLPLWASKIFAEEKTEILPTSPTNRVLVTRGPFRFSRNPMYLGMVTMLIGVAIMLGTLPVFISAMLFFTVISVVFIPFEEAKMRRQFDGAFDEYQKKVRRWL